MRGFHINSEFFLNDLNRKKLHDPGLAVFVTADENSHSSLVYILTFHLCQC